jgi:two-component system sensor histidine kinase QseC
VIARIDANSLQSIFQNLLSNAIRYGQRGGNVVVELAIEHSMLVLTVADDGPGIPIYERELVFERFYRVAGTDVSGSGLGLAIVLQAVTRLAGSVRLESGLGGAGCKFTIQIPI